MWIHEQFFFSSLRFVLYCVLHFFKWLIQTHTRLFSSLLKKIEVLKLSFFVAEKRLNLQLNPHRLRRSTCSEPHDWQREEDKRGVTLWSAYGEQPGRCAQLGNMIRSGTPINERRRPSLPLLGPYTQCALGCSPALCDVTQGTSDNL